MSLPARSDICSGPIGIPNARIGPSTSAGSAPNSSMKRASRTYPSSIRLPMKPKQLPASTAFFPNSFPIAIAVASVVGLDAAPRTFSSSGITFAGEKKCVPTTASGREVAAAISSMLSVDVFVARIAPCLHAPSSCLRTVCLIDMRSNTASTAMSAAATPASSYVVVVRMRPTRSSNAAALSLPLSTCRCQLPRIVLRPRSSASADVSMMVTGTPRSAKHIAMPPPIVPAPTIAALLSGNGFTALSNPSTFPIARSAKKTC